MHNFGKKLFISTYIHKWKAQGLVVLRGGEGSVHAILCVLREPS